MLNHDPDLAVQDGEETFDVEQYDPDALDFVQMTMMILRNPSLSPTARTVYGLLVAYANISKQQREAEAQGIKVRGVYPKRKTLAADLGRSTDTLDRAIAELVAAKIVTVRPNYVITRSGKRRQTSNTYVLNDRRMLQAAREARGLTATRGSRIKPEWQGADPLDIEFAEDHAHAHGFRPEFVEGAPDVGGPGAWRHR